MNTVLLFSAEMGFWEFFAVKPQLSRMKAALLSAFRRNGCSSCPSFERDRNSVRMAIGRLIRGCARYAGPVQLYPLFPFRDKGLYAVTRVR